MNPILPPAEVERIVESLDAEPRRHIVRNLGIAAALVVFLGIAALAWRWLSSSAGVDTTRLIAFLNEASEWPLSPFVTLLVYAVGGLIVFPLNLLIAATVVTFGPIAGTCYALLGSLTSAALLYEIGRFAPERLRRLIVNSRTERVIERIARRGVLAVAIVRLLPLAPYSVVCLLAGTARIGRIAYLAGTAIGLLPGIVLYALFADRARAVLENPRPQTYLLLILAIAAILCASLLLQGYLRHVRYRRKRD